MNPLVTVHLFRVPARKVPAALGRMAADRRHLRRTAGLAFWKLLGTGRSTTLSLRDADPTLWGLLGVWDGAAALVAFERGSPVARGWGRLAVERWRADLRPVRSQGRWSGRAPFGDPHPAPVAGPVAAVTRARLRPLTAHRFRQAVPPVTAGLHASSGLLVAVGIGEAPVGLQGTFSLWRDEDSLRTFAYRGAAHRAAIRRTAEVGWYAEELFARFAVLQCSGTLFGGDPLTPDQ